MRVEIDTHTHTLASGHAYNTMNEMAKAAADKGLKGLAITEHAPEMPGTCHLYYFQNLRIVPRKRFGIELLLGTELNIMNAEGKVDLSEDVLKTLDIAIASIHIPCFRDERTVENVTAAYENVMENPYVDIIGHPDDDRFPLDYEKLVKAAAKEKVALEVNNSSFSPRTGRLNADKNLPVMLSFCKKYKVPVIVDSDAHIFYDIGNLDRAKEMLEACEFPKKLILNTKLKGLSYVLNLEREETREKYDHMMED